jgi:ribonuclease BN (tRNA processing enzyme)
VKITVLGKSPAWQDVDGACSGYLVEDQGCRLLIDCGNGVFSKLRRFVDYVDVDAVVISHLHADHFLDLVPFSYALTYAPRQQPVPVDGWPGTDHPARPALHAPPGARDCFRRVVGAWGNEDLIENAFDLREYDPSEVLHAGPLTLRFQVVPHFVVSHAVEITSAANGGRRLTYGADSSPSDDLCAFAQGTDLLLIEATLPRRERAGPRGGRPAARPHPSFGRAGRRLGRGRSRAHVRRSGRDRARGCGLRALKLGCPPARRVNSR